MSFKKLQLINPNDIGSPEYGHIYLGRDNLGLWEKYDNGVWRYIITGSTMGDGTSGSSGKDGQPGLDGIFYGSSGRSGSSGISGTFGTSGTSGKSGSQGTSGSSGSSGLTGTAGTSGTSGDTGSSGTSGVGSAGTSGISGSSGVDGNFYGSSGSSGYSGGYGAATRVWINTNTTPPTEPGTFYVPSEFGSINTFQINKKDVDGSNLQAWITNWTSGVLKIEERNNPEIFGLYSISDAPVFNGGGYFTFTIPLVNILAASGEAIVSKDYLISFVQVGSGSSGSSGKDGINGEFLGSSGTSGVGITGSSGSSGANGVTGTSGTSGDNGTSGTSGINGINGSTGTSGTSGIGNPGSSGTSGKDGSGSSGTSGSSGIGNPGSSGTSGKDGSGSSGTSGNSTSGSSGVSGSSGFSGTSGVSGVSGTSGVSGSSGVSSTGTSIWSNWIGASRLSDSTISGSTYPNISIKKGTPVRYRSTGGTWRYGIVTNISGYTHTIAGYSCTTSNDDEFQYGILPLVKNVHIHVSGDFADNNITGIFSTSGLLFTDLNMSQHLCWKYPNAFIVEVAAVCFDNDTVSGPYIQLVNSSGGTFANVYSSLQVSKSINSTTVAEDTDYQVYFNNSLDFSVTAGGGMDAKDIDIYLTFVLDNLF